MYCKIHSKSQIHVNTVKFRVSKEKLIVCLICIWSEYVVRINTNNENPRKNVKSGSRSTLTFGCTFFKGTSKIPESYQINNKIAKPNPHVTYARIALKKPLQKMEIF